MATPFLKLKNHYGLIRDTYSSAIIRENGNDYDLYMAQKRKSEQNKDELRGAIREINTLKKELREIKSLIKEVIIK